MPKTNTTSGSKRARPNTRAKAVAAAAPRPRKTNAIRKGAAVAAERPGTTQPRSDTKQGRVIELLQQEGGASLDDLVVATGWLPHTTRAALTRLRQGGHAISRSKDQAGRTVYRIAPAARASRAREAA